MSVRQVKSLFSVLFGNSAAAIDVKTCEDLKAYIQIFHDAIDELMIIAC